MFARYSQSNDFKSFYELICDMTGIPPLPDSLPPPLPKQPIPQALHEPTPPLPKYPPNINEDESTIGYDWNDFSEVPDSSSNSLKLIRQTAQPTILISNPQVDSET